MAKHRRGYVKQADAPKHSIEEALRVARAIEDQCGGSSTPPLIVGQAMGLTPTSRAFVDLCGSSIAYGFTMGGSRAKKMSITDLGKRALSEIESDRNSALREAILKPTALSQFLKRYNSNQFPKEEVAIKMLESDAGIESTKAKELLPLIRQNAEFAGILRTIKGKSFIHLGSAEGGAESDSNSDSESQGLATNDFQSTEQPQASTDSHSTEIANGTRNRRVFIAHGSNKKIVEQIRELLEIANFDPVIAVRQETSAKPIPHKIRDEMSDCRAGIIHVGLERHVKDDEGKEHTMLNSNVLIEIGASMALYGDNFVLLVEEGVTLPSNLQGLSVIEYQGNTMDADTIFRLLRSLKRL